MTVTEEQLRADLRKSMLAKDTDRTRTLRSVLTALKLAEVGGTEAVKLSDAQVAQVIAKQAKQRRESITEYEKAGRDDLVALESGELAILLEYLPPQLSESEIADLVSQAIADADAAGQGMKAMGAVMGRVTPLVIGRADGKLVAEIVRQQLAAG